MSSNPKTNNDDYVDLAAERLAELFIKQAKYNRSNKKLKNPQTPQYIEQIKLHLRYSWDPVFRDETNEYHYPMAITPPMKKQYKKPAIYKWNIYKHSPDDQKKIYIGEAAILCPTRLQGYLKPGPSQHTNIRMKNMFSEYINQGLKIRLEVLNLQHSTIGKIPVTQEDLANKYVRRYIEAIMITHFQDKNYTLLNH